MSKRFPYDFLDRGVVKLTDRLLIHNVDTGLDEYITVAQLLTARGLVGQLQFPAVQIPSADPNTLDDYREGTFVPVLNAFTFTAGGLYTIDGRYVKLGNTILIGINIQLIGGETIACNAGVSNISAFPYDAGVMRYTLPVMNGSTIAQLGIGQLVGSVFYPSMWGATAANNLIIISGSYQL